MSKIDLSELRMDAAPAAPPKRPWGPRVAGGLLLVIVLAVAASFLWPMLRPVQSVRTTSVLQVDVETTGTRIATAEATGWIEPDPFPIVVRPLVAGVLEELPLLEGMAVKANETVVGRIRSAELTAAHDRATAALALAEANLKHRHAELDVARKLLEQKSDLRLTEASARHEVTVVAARLAARRKDLDAAKADADAARAELAGQEKLQAAGGTYPVALAKARAAVTAADARVAAKAKEIEAFEAELAQDKITLEIAREVLEDPRALQGEVDMAEANLKHLAAQRDAAKVELDIANRELAWATVRSPVDGVVMKLLAAPGARIGPEGDGIVALYHPKRLQARIDVPLASVGGVRVGQEVEIRCEILGSKRVKGRVLRVQRESDMLKNTLEVKVRILEPDPLLRPETLVRARFLGETGDTPSSGAAPAVFKLPRAAVRGGAVYVLDPEEGRARRVAVELVGDDGRHVLVRGDLSATQDVILDEVEDGARVKEES